MKKCANCKYFRDVGPYFACYGQKYAPKVDWNDVCDDWKPEHVTNADRIRAMSDEELAEFMYVVTGGNGSSGSCVPGCYDCRKYNNDCKEAWLDWLKREVNDGD